MPDVRPILIDLPERLVGQRLVVRPWHDADAPALFHLIDESREHIRRWLAWADGHRSIDDTRAFVRHCIADWALRDNLAMGIFDHDDRLLGSVGLHPRDWRIPSFEIGYWIAARFEGKGYVAEAVKLVTAFAFDSLHANRLMIRCDTRNKRSANVARRCGYLLEGTLRSDFVAPDGALRDTYFFAMLPADYTAARRTW